MLKPDLQQYLELLEITRVLLRRIVAYWCLSELHGTDRGASCRSDRGAILDLVRVPTSNPAARVALKDETRR